MKSGGAPLLFLDIGKAPKSLRRGPFSGEYPFNVRNTAKMQNGVKYPKSINNHAATDNKTNNFAVLKSIVAVS